jgi:hypothetical protein
MITRAKTRIEIVSENKTSLLMQLQMPQSFIIFLAPAFIFWYGGGGRSCAVNTDTGFEF